MSMVAERYAQALLNLAIADGNVEKYQTELEAVSQTYEEEKNGLSAFLLSPRSDLPVKKSMLKGLFQERVGRNILHFLLLLLDKDRIRSLPEICRAYVHMADEYRNILNLTVSTAFPLNKEQLDGIGKTFQSLYHGSSVKIAVETDVSLIGGVKVTVYGSVYDGTVKGKLSRMQSAINP